MNGIPFKSRVLEVILFQSAWTKKGSEGLWVLFYTDQLWLLFVQPAIISNVSTGSPQPPVKVQAEVLYNFPIFPAPGVLNCIGRWIFLASEAVMSPLGKPLCTSTPAMKANSARDGGESKLLSQVLPLQWSTGHFSLSDSHIFYKNILQTLYAFPCLSVM